jgi:N-acetyltransferase
MGMFLARMRLRAKPGVVRPGVTLSCASATTAQAGTPTWGFPAASSSRSHSGRAPRKEQSGWSFRVVEDGSELVLQKLAGDEWADAYGFQPQPVPLINVETSSWWTSTQPRSLFATGLIVGVHGDDGTGTLLCDWSGLSFSEQTPAARA